jgi:trehalose/maltose hydrolase-like predicted phosphorylase
MDRLLKAEGQSPDEYKVAKQADTLMTFYNLDKQEVDQILREMDYHLPADYLHNNLRYYLARTSHGSTLSRVVHAKLANMAGDKELSWTLYKDALTSDYQDIQGGTTAEGIHAGVMAGTIWIAISTYAGLNLRSDRVAFDPDLPGHWREVSFGFTFRGIDYKCQVSHDFLRLQASLDPETSVRIMIRELEYDLTDNGWHEFAL